MLSGVSCKCPVCMAHFSHSLFWANLSSHCGAFNFGARQFHFGVRTWALFTCSPSHSYSLAMGKVFLFTNASFLLQMHICFPSNFVMKLSPLNSGNFSLWRWFQFQHIGMLHQGFQSVVDQSRTKCKGADLLKQPKSPQLMAGSSLTILRRLDSKDNIIYPLDKKLITFWPMSGPMLCCLIFMDTESKHLLDFTICNLWCHRASPV